jgi:FMN reductase
MRQNPASGHPTETPPPIRLIVLSAGVSEPSSTRLLADRITQKALDLLRDGESPAVVNVIELGPLAIDIARAIVSGFPGDRLQTVIQGVAEADALIVSTPIYKAGMSGLFKSFIDVLDNDLLIGKPIILAATAGTARHAMVVDEHLRPLFAFLRAMPVPTSLFAAPEDWSDAALSPRIERAALELVALIRGGVGRSIAESGWGAYQHQFAGNASRAERGADDVDFDTALMKLAAGGSSRPQPPTVPAVSPE